MVKRKERQRDGLISRFDVPQQGYRQQQRTKARHSDSILRTCTETSSTRGERAKERERARERAQRGRGPHRKVRKREGWGTRQKVKIEKKVDGFAGFAGPQEQPAAQDFLTSRAHPRSERPKGGDHEWKLAPVAGLEWITRTRDGSPADEVVLCVVCAAAAAANYSIPSWSIDRSTGGPQSNIPSWIAVETA
ncbi:hypothetical protein BO85DRAFT_458538 [Aspergillus piperis CBS 112811]|uniref:Uncharacterized protein n=1 Tax=Aspergillus piperis CBS 112811 TaxID=1448313 RepID=A0A8G1VN53_9EURO|nr:hypothetical protein BO85DRAFT_458538 [Aspergillus piperis CBS 112811]RAH59421.1 hypothetical protein BO85DRAFT_458538 [Aspergillus piperis CBS 112811]